MINEINKFASGTSYQAVVNRSPINYVFIDPLCWYLVVREIGYFEVGAEKISMYTMSIEQLLCEHNRVHTNNTNHVQYQS